MKTGDGLEIPTRMPYAGRVWGLAGKSVEFYDGRMTLRLRGGHECGPPDRQSVAMTTINMLCDPNVGVGEPR